MGLSNSAVAKLKAKATSCGYDAAWAQVTYPPKGKIAFPNNGKDIVALGCDLDNQLYTYGRFIFEFSCNGDLTNNSDDVQLQSITHALTFVRAVES